MKKVYKILFAMFILLISVYGASAVEVNSSTEIYTFSITNEQANPTAVGCPSATIRFNASISPPAFIDYVTFRIEGNNYQASSSGSHFYYDYSKSTTVEDLNTTIDWDRITITDVGAGSAVYNPDVHVTLDCDACDYTIIEGSCTTSDDKLVQYIGSGAGNCTSYNETQGCNYCSEDIVENVITPCDGVIKEVNYVDNNQASCCDVTGLLSDCSILYTPYNETINTSCSYLSEEFNLNCDQYPNIESRMECLVDLNSDEDYKCWTLVRYFREDGVNTQNYLQINPSQKVTTINLKNLIFPEEQELREYFSIVNGMGNVYYTDQDIIGDTDYVLEVRCVDEDGNLAQSEMIIHPQYKSLEKELPSRGVWLKENSTGLIIYSILFVFLCVTLLILYMAFIER